jgi:hypothetical protein
LLLAEVDRRLSILGCLLDLFWIEICLVMISLLIKSFIRIVPPVPNPEPGDDPATNTLPTFLDQQFLPTGKEKSHYLFFFPNFIQKVSFGEASFQSFGIRQRLGNDRQFCTWNQIGIDIGGVKV